MLNGARAHSLFFVALISNNNVLFNRLCSIKKYGNAVCLACLLCCFIIPAKAQYFDVDSVSKRVTIPFKLVRNLVVIELKINNKGSFNFVLDSGVGLMIITDPSLVDTINIPNKHSIKVSGFGEGKDFEAYITPPLKIDIPGLISYNVAAAVLKNHHFDLSGYAGVPIHGLLGYEFFSKLAVKIDFEDSTVTVCRPQNMRFYKRATTIPISIEGNKPYLTTKITYSNGMQKEDKMIIDLGAGHAVSLENVADKNKLQNKFIRANLGMGIKGLISGSISRINEIELGKYKLKNVIAAFPDEATEGLTVRRDGNIGIDLLKKFDIIFDYPQNLICLKPNIDYHTRFEHDMSGLAYSAEGNDYNHIMINRVEPGSAGDETGLQKGDEIISINFKPVTSMTLQQIDNLFRSENGKNLLIEIYHDKKYYSMLLTLKRRI
jgi:hypothetical protein